MKLASMVLAAGVALAGLVAPKVQADPAPVLVELYTSQGCSSCPPADELLRKLAQRDGVIALALHVDYWDYLGWKDDFARAAHTKRQKAYAHASGRRTIYTPQIMIGGQDDVVGARAMEIMDLVMQHQAAPPPVTVSLTRRGGTLRIRAEAKSKDGSTEALRPATTAGLGPMVVDLVRYDPSAKVKVRRGENAGRTLTYTNIVTAWDRVGTWTGDSALDLSVEVSGDAPIVVILQQEGPGPVVSVARLR